MTDTLNLNPSDDDQKLLAKIVGYYHDTLKQTPEAQDYLRRRKISNAQVIDHFRIGFSDRSLGLKLPPKAVQAGQAIRSRLQQLGLFRDSGHEHFRGSITFPICAGDGTGQIVDIYGRKIRDDLRAGTPTHTHLNDNKRGVWNIEAFGSTEEVVLCGGLFDALTLWSHNHKNATCMFGETLSQDMLDAFKEFRIKRVLTPCEHLTEKLLEAGLEVFLLKLPLNTDINAYACKVDDSTDALGSLLRSAEWLGRGRATVSAPAPQEKEPVAEVQPPPMRTTTTTTSPVPTPSAEVEAEVSDDEVSMSFGNRRYRVRGLNRNTALDVLRVNLFVSNGDALYIDTFDLYSARHRQAFQKHAAEELSVDESVVKKDLGKVLLKLEEIQDANLQALMQPKPTEPEPTEEREAALRLLREPDLLHRIARDFAVVGEPVNKLVGYLAAVSRKLDQPLAVIIQSTSAAGKSTLMDAVLSFVPPEDVVKFSAMTGQSLYYMGEGSLQNKILAIVEEEGASRASYALKLLQSEGELRIASTGKELSTGRLTTQEYRVEGPVMLFLTTTSIQVDEELLSRCLVLTVDEDRQQTRQIHQLQRLRQTLQGQLAAQTHQETQKLHRNAQKLLRPLLVANPFAERLTFHDAKTRTRRDHLKYLTLIRAVTLLHQHQRPIKTVLHQGQPVEYIEVTLEDIAMTNNLACDVLGRSLDELPPQTRRLLCLISSMVTEACQREGVSRAEYRFSRRQVRESTGWGDTQLKVHLRRLLEMEYLILHREGPTRLYELAYDAPNEGSKASPGLIDVEALRQAEWAGPEGHRAGSGRPSVGPQSGQGRGHDSDANTVQFSTNGMHAD